MATITPTAEQRENLLCSALEGGSNYWYFLDKDAIDLIDSVIPFNKDIPLVTRMWKAIEAGKKIPVHEYEDNRVLLGKISLASIKKGEQIMADKYIHHFTDIMSSNDDSITGDVWFQLAVMGKIEYA